MLFDARLEKLCKLLVRYSLDIRRDDLVLITGIAATEPAIILAVREVLAAGGNPWVRMTSDACQEALLKHGNERQIGYLAPFEKTLIQTINARLSFWTEENTKYLANVDPARQAMLGQARRPIMDIFMKRAALPDNDPKRLRWCGTGFPTNAFAQDAEMSLSDYADFVFSAGKLNSRDPVAEWKKLSVSQKRLADHLDKRSELRIRAPGTDIRFGIRGRRWINCDGHENFPDGEVFTGPIEDATEGVVQFTFPAIYDGRDVDGVRLVFKAGRVVEASATKNEAFLIQMLDQDRGARVFGELALGTNYDIQRFTRNTLFDEKIGGTFHAALGMAYPESGGTNKSALHWDMVCELRKGGVVEADGKVISRNGKFQKADWPR